MWLIPLTSHGKILIEVQALNRVERHRQRIFTIKAIGVGLPDNFTIQGSDWNIRAVSIIGTEREQMHKLSFARVYA